MENNQTKSRKRHWPLVIIVSLIFGGLAGILADKILFPYLSAIPALSKYKIFKTEGKEIIIEKTIEKTVSIKEEEAFLEVAKKVMPALVAIEKVQLCLKKEICKPELISSGFILSSDGLIATGKQNLNKEEKYQVITDQGKIYQVEEILFDPASSLAFLKIKAENLPVVDLGWPEDIRLGRKILALGKSQNLANTLELGILKDINFSLFDPYSSHKEKLTQALASNLVLDSNFLGGPVISLDGKVIGLNVIADKQYILPVDVLRSAFESQTQFKKIARSYLGILYLDLHPSFSRLNNIAKDFGALIYSADPKTKPIISGSPAERAGLKALDIILALDKNTIDQEKNFDQILRKYKPGDEVELTVLRGEEEIKIKVKLGEMEKTE